MTTITTTDLNAAYEAYLQGGKTPELYDRLAEACMERGATITENFKARHRLHNKRNNDLLDNCAFDVFRKVMNISEIDNFQNIYASSLSKQLSETAGRKMSAYDRRHPNLPDAARDDARAPDASFPGKIDGHAAWALKEKIKALFKKESGESIETFLVSLMQDSKERRTYECTANAMDIPLGTVMSRLNHIKGKLQRLGEIIPIEDREAAIPVIREALDELIVEKSARGQTAGIA